MFSNYGFYVIPREVIELHSSFVPGDEIRLSVDEPVEVFVVRVGEKHLEKGE